MNRLHPATIISFFLRYFIRGFFVLFILYILGFFLIGMWVNDTPECAEGCAGPPWLTVAAQIIVWVFPLYIVGSFIWAIATYLAYGYTLDAQGLHIQRGILKKVSQVIPRERIQNIDVKQGVFQRLLRMVSIGVQTAAEPLSDKPEGVLPGLSLKKATELRRYLTMPTLANTETEAVHIRDGQRLPFKALFCLIAASVYELLFLPIILLQLGAGFSALFFFVLFFMMFTLALARMEAAARLVETIMQTTGSFIFAPLVGGPVEAWLATVRTILVAFILYMPLWAYFTYHFFRYKLGEDSLHIVSGIISRSAVSIPYAAIQDVIINRSLFHRLFGLSQLSIETAGLGTIPGRRGQEFIAEGEIPALEKEEAEQLQGQLLRQARAAKEQTV